MDSNKETIVFGGGCFWCTEAVFNELKGIISVMPGYAGGHPPDGGENPTYEEVSSGKTGHAEVTKIEFDPRRIALKDLLTVFFATHDPTTLNRQGADIGTQYRSIILFTNEKQKEEAQQFIEDLNKEKGDQIVTEVKPLIKFFPAEDYHLNYFEKNPDKAYCQIVINPKLEKIQKQFTNLLKSHSQEK